MSGNEGLTGSSHYSMIVQGASFIQGYDTLLFSFSVKISLN